MKSLVLVAPKKGQVELQELEVSEPGPGEVRVRIHMSVISPGTERAVVLGMENTTAQYPVQPGYSAAGEVEMVGAEVTRFAVGDRVACHLGHRTVGNVKEGKVVRIPAGVPFDKAAFLLLGMIALQGIRKARIELGEGVMVLGLGIVGQLALQFARLNGALPTIGADRIGKRLKIALDCGADWALDTSDKCWREILKNKTDEKGAQIVIEATGAPEIIAAAFQSARPSGRVVLLGSPRGESTVNFYRDVHKTALTVIGAHMFANPPHDSHPGYWTWQDDANCFMRFLQSQRIQIEPLITGRVCREKVEETYRSMLTGNPDMVGTVIKWI